MAWETLNSIYRNKSEDETARTRDTRANAGNIGSKSSAVAAPLTGWGGDGGSAGAPTSSKFVNFGTMYDLNKDKAAGMAKGLYDSAQAKAEGAQGKLNDARGAFANQVAGGTARGTIGGKHGTRVEDFTATTETDPKTGVKSQKNIWVGPQTAGGKAVEQGTGNPFHALYSQASNPNSDGSTRYGHTERKESLEGEGYYSGEQVQSETNRSMQAGARNRYADLLGTGDRIADYDFTVRATPGEKAAMADYHHTVSSGQANSMAGQDYTGPASLKESMGDDAYGALAEDLRKAEQGTQQLGDAAGIATALGYEPGGSIGMSALDAGLTETAGRPQFKQLGEKYKGLSGTLSKAQSESIGDSIAAKSQSDATANQWKKLMDDYTEATKPKAEAEKTPAEAAYDETAFMTDWADFVGAGPTDTMMNEVGHGVGRVATFGAADERGTFEQLTAQGFSNDQIMAAYRKYRKANPKDKYPSMEQLATIILGGG